MTGRLVFDAPFESVWVRFVSRRRERLGGVRGWGQGPGTVTVPARAAIELVLDRGVERELVTWVRAAAPEVRSRVRALWVRKLSDTDATLDVLLRELPRLERLGVRHSRSRWAWARHAGSLLSAHLDGMRVRELDPRPLESLRELTLANCGAIPVTLAGRIAALPRLRRLTIHGPIGARAIEELLEGRLRVLELDARECAETLRSVRAPGAARRIPDVVLLGGALLEAERRDALGVLPWARRVSLTPPYPDRLL